MVCMVGDRPSLSGTLTSPELLNSMALLRGVSPDENGKFPRHQRQVSTEINHNEEEVCIMTGFKRWAPICTIQGLHVYTLFTSPLSGHMNQKLHQRE